jgi:hypothetical protein
VPKPAKYHYWQVRPYRPAYHAFINLSHMYNNQNRIAIVSRHGSKWYAINDTDIGAEGVAKTRDAAVDDLLEKIGGLG